MRDFILTNMDNIKFVYNFHATGNYFVEPFNGIDDKILPVNFPKQSELFKELLAEGHPPEGIKFGEAKSLLGYVATGEASDWIMAATGIPCISPELSTADPVTKRFYLEKPEHVIATVDGFYPIIEKTMQKLDAKLEVEATALRDLGDGKFSFTLNMLNKGMDDMI